MQDGLHIGLAAWIGEHVGSNDGGSFTSWPATPVALELAPIDAPRDAQELAQAVEFARLVNFVPAKGGYAKPFESTNPLWGVHRAVLEDMEFAERAWTEAEQQEFSAARAVLYEDSEDAGFPVMTEAFQLYEELRRAFIDLEASGANAALLAMAMEAWMTQGKKATVEGALQAFLRLTSRSSLTQAETERLELQRIELEQDPHRRHAPTFYSPLSAINPETWLEVEVDVQDLDAAVGKRKPCSKWSSWLANRRGTVRFRYAVLDLHRAWFTALLYEADDWKLADSGVVSKGDGHGGRLPAYVQRVFLVRLEALKVVGRRVRPAPGSSLPTLRRTPTMGLALHAGSVKFTANPDDKRPSLALPRDMPPRKEVVTRSSRPQQSRSSALSMRTRGALSAISGGERSIARHPRPTLTAPPTHRTSLIEMDRFRITQGSTQLLLNRSMLATQVLLARRSPSIAAAEPPPAITQVVGFASRTVPVSPRPNPDYVWNG